VEADGIRWIPLDSVRFCRILQDSVLFPLGIVVLNILNTLFMFQVRRKAQFELFSILNHYHLSFHVIVDRIVELLNTPNEIDHDQIKVRDLYFFDFYIQFFIGLSTCSSW